MNIILLSITCCILPYLWLRICNKLWIVEHKKRAEHYKRKPVANIQWLPMWITLIICIIILWPEYINNHYMLMYIGVTAALVAISRWDLFRPIPSWIRLLFQILLFWSIVYYWWITIDSINIWGNSFMINKRIGIIAWIIWFIVCTNAVNRFDGIEGQSSGITTIGSFSIRAVIIFIVLPTYTAITPHIIDQLTITQNIALALWIVSFVYTIIEYKPSGLIRDIGTTVYWFSLAYLALLWWAKIWTLMVTLSLVLFDRVWVIAYRICIMKKNPLKWDYTHLHHRLIANGRSRNEVRWFVWIRSTVMTVLMLLQWTNSIHKRIILIMMASLFFGVNVYLFIVKKLPTAMKVDFDTKEVEKLA